MHDANLARGPSPRGWGNRMVLPALQGVTRAIPTRVGKSKRGPTLMQSATGHPHAGGEIDGTRLGVNDLVGPSPRGWGNHLETHLEALADRAIPTRVGKSSRSTKDREQDAGHPHAGGEIRLTFANAAFFHGPSPRGWGNPLRACGGCCCLRAIPTRVGKSAALA